MLPAQVERAKYANDTEALSAMGRKGAAKRFEKIEGARLEAERATEKRAEEDAFRRTQAGEDILPPNSID